MHVHYPNTLKTERIKVLCPHKLNDGKNKMFPRLWCTNWKQVSFIFKKTTGVFTGFNANGNFIMLRYVYTLQICPLLSEVQCQWCFLWFCTPSWIQICFPFLLKERLHSLIRRNILALRMVMKFNHALQLKNSKLMTEPRLNCIR